MFISSTCITELLDVSGIETQLDKETKAQPVASISILSPTYGLPRFAP